jgi:hypothetical protein
VEWLGKRKPHDWPNAKPKHGIPAPELALPTSITAKPELGLAALGNLKTSVEFVSHSTRSPACVSAGRPSSSAASSSSAVETPQHNAPEPVPREAGLVARGILATPVGKGHPLLVLPLSHQKAIYGRRQSEKGLSKETPEQLGRRVKKSKVTVSGTIEIDC